MWFDPIGPCVRVKLEHPNAVKPQRAHEGDSGWDVYSVEDLWINVGNRAMVSLGLKLEIPQGYEIQIRPRSGLAAKHGITVLNSPGTVDSSFKGEIKVILINTSQEDFHVTKGMRIAQMVPAVVAQLGLIQVEEPLGSSDRGEGGFGSSGV